MNNTRWTLRSDQQCCSDVVADRVSEIFTEPSKPFPKPEHFRNCSELPNLFCYRRLGGERLR